MLSQGHTHTHMRKYFQIKIIRLQHWAIINMWVHENGFSKGPQFWAALVAGFGGNILGSRILKIKLMGESGKLKFEVIND